MATTLSDFLISIKYTVDAASQNNFIVALQKAAGAVGQTAAAVVGLNAGIIALGKQFAEVGEKFYFMSSRFGSGVGDIKDAAYAMSQLGLSTEAAQGQMESFGAWTRSMGPAASMYLRSIGVTARDTTGRMNQLGDALRRMGGTKEFAQGNDAQRLQYAIALQHAKMAGLNEQGMLGLTDKDREKNEKRAGFIRSAVWGVKTKEEADAAEAKWAETSHKMMGQFREFGLTFQAMRSKFGEALMERLLPVMEKFQKLLLDNMPAITTWLDKAAKGLVYFVQATQSAIEVFTKLPGVVQAAIAAILLLPSAFKLMASPLGQMLILLGAIMLVFDDWATYHRGGKSLINWGKVDDFIKPFKEMSTGIDAWFTKLTGIETSFTAIAAAVLLILTRFKSIQALGGLRKILFGGTGTPPVVAGPGGVLPGPRAPKAPPVGRRTAALTGNFAAIALDLYNNPDVMNDDQMAEYKKNQGPWAEGSPADRLWKWMTAGRRSDDIAAQRQRLMGEITGAGSMTEAQSRELARLDAQLNETGATRAPTQAGQPVSPAVEREHQEGAKTFWEKAIDFLKEGAMGSSMTLSQGRSPTGNMFAGPGAPGFAGDMRTLPGGGWAGAALRQQFGEDGAGSIEGIGGGGPGSGGDVSGSGAKMLSQYFQSQGWSKEQSAGIIANLIKESGLNPRAHGDKGQARGIAQWHPDRQARFRKVMGKDVFDASLLEQAQFVQWELTNTEAAAGRRLQGQTSAYGAAGVVSRYYERPGNTFSEMEERGQKAEHLMGTLGSYTRTAPLGADGAPPGAAGAALRERAGNRLNQNNNTNIRIEHGKNAAETANRVAMELPRAHERFIRMAEGRLLA